MKEEDIPKPIGEFIIENASGRRTNTGTYYHYKDVCKLLKLYKEKLVLTEVVETKPEGFHCALELSGHQEGKCSTQCGLCSKV